MGENPYASPKGDVPVAKPREKSLRGMWDPILFSLIAFAAAPAIWTVIWFFGIYLAKSDPNDYFTPTEWEKFDALYGYYVWTFFISIFVTPVVLYWRLVVNSNYSN